LVRVQLGDPLCTGIMKRDHMIRVKAYIKIQFLFLFLLFAVHPLLLADSSNGNGSDDYKKCIIAGKKFISEKNYSEAIKTYQSAISLNDKNEKAFVYLGYAYYRNNQPSLAEDAFKKAINLNPQSSLAHYNLALSYWVFKKSLSSKSASLAMSELVLALKLDPSLQAKVKGDPKFRNVLRMQTFQNSMQVEAEFETKNKKLNDEANFAPLTAITFKDDLVKLSSEFLKAQIITPNSRFAEAYDIDGDDDDNIVLKKRFQSLGLVKDNSTGAGYYSEINDTPLILWMIYDKTYLIDTRKPTQAVILSEKELNVIETVTAKIIKKDFYYIDIEQDPGAGSGRVSDSWSVNLETKRYKQVNGD